MKMKELINKTILITGANGLLGKSIVNNFIGKRAKLILIDIKKQKKFKNSHQYQCDFTNESKRELTFNEIKKKHKKIDIVINCAGYTNSIKDKNWITSFEKQDLKNWKNAIEVNLSSIFHLIKVIKKNMPNKNGIIINIGSIYSVLSPDPNLYIGLPMSSPAAYSASKGGLLLLTKWLAANLAPNIRVNMISTIGIKNKQSSIFVNRYLKKIPLKKMCTQQDVVNMINFLISEKSNMITGQNLIIDGGYSLI